MTEFGLIKNRRSHALPAHDKWRPEIIRQRIDAMPAFDTSARMQGITGLLAEIAAACPRARDRRALFDVLDEEIKNLVSGYQQQVSHHALPLSPKRYAVYRELQDLLSCAASAYGQLVQDLLQAEEQAASELEIRDAIMRCMDYLSQQAVQAYAVYQEAPPSIWEALHRLYAYAEQKQLATEVVEHLSDLSISGAYARVVLLAISNPCHLLQGEVYEAYRRLGKWGLAVRFEHPDGLPPAPLAELISGRYYCDLAGQSPPAFGAKEATVLPECARLINLNEVLRIIENRMKGLALESRKSLASRAEWDLLLRLRRAWEKRATRITERKAERGTSLKAIIGLSSCHGFFSAYQAFEPEKSEISLHGDDFQQPQALSLVSADAKPWLDTDTATKLEAGVIKPRAYCFDVENTENDIWKKSHVNRSQDTTLEKTIEERRQTTIFEFKLTNSSTGGHGLETKAGSAVQLRVGELVALFPEGDDDTGDPVLNVVRWLRAVADSRLQAGVCHLEGIASALAVRALDDEAVYKEYTRAFLLEDSEDSTIIVPAGQFSCGQVLVMNDEERLQLCRLGSVLENTRAFSRFEFQLFEPDPTHTDRIINSLRKLLRRDED